MMYNSIIKVDVYTIIKLKHKKLYFSKLFIHYVAQISEPAFYFNSSVEAILKGPANARPIFVCMF